MRGRARGDEPWCRSVCIRKVFPHEVRKLMRIVEKGPTGPVTKDVEVDKKIPLPPEGQNLPWWLMGRSAPPREDDADDDDDDPEVGSLKGWKNVANDVEQEKVAGAGETAHGAAGKGKEPEVWKQGWYVWTTKNKWAVQDKLDTMMNDLERQAEWTKTKRDVNEEWARARKAEELGAKQPKTQPEGSDAPDPHAAPSHSQSSPNVVFVSEDSLNSLPTPPFPDSSSNSLLLPLPPPLPPIQNSMANLLAPMVKVLTLTHEKVVSGEQRELAAKLWEKAKTDQPWTLAKIVMERTWSVWNNNGGDDDDSDHRRA